MRKCCFLVVSVLVAGVALATAQATTPTNQSVSPKPGSDQPPSTGMQTGTPGQGATNTGNAQSQIQNAIKDDPRLSHDNIMVGVTGEEIDLTGEVSSKQEKDEASKTADKYAGSLRVENHLQVRGRSPAAASSSDVSPGQTGTSPDKPDNNLGGFAGDALGSTAVERAGAATTAQSSPAVASGGGTPGVAPDLPENGTSASELQTQIQSAVRNEPTLASDNVNVSVSSDEIDLSGSVATPKEKLTAQRIAQSYAGNRKVKDQLTVNGHNRLTPQ